MKPEFDTFAEEYNAVNNTDAMRVTGFPLEYFTNYKADDICREIAANQLGPEKFLDFGCGIGNTLKSLSSRVPDLKLFGAEVSASSLELAKSRGIPAELAFIESALPFADASFDVTFASCVFHHIPDVQQGKWADELFRVTDQNGMVMIYEHNPFNPVTRHVFANSPFDVNAKMLTPSMLKTLLRNAGFRDLRVKYRVFFPKALHWLLFAERALTWLPLGAQFYITGKK